MSSVRHSKKSSKRHATTTSESATAQPYARMKRMMHRNGLRRLQKAKRTEIQQVLDEDAAQYMMRLTTDAMGRMVAYGRSRLQGSDLAQAARRNGVLLTPRAGFAFARRVNRRRALRREQRKNKA